MTPEKIAEIRARCDELHFTAVSVPFSQWTTMTKKHVLDVIHDLPTLLDALAAETTRADEAEQKDFFRTVKMSKGCEKCEYSDRYGMVGDRYCRILGVYFTGNVKPPYKERPDECPITKLNNLVRERDRLKAERDELEKRTEAAEKNLIDITSDRDKYKKQLEANNDLRNYTDAVVKKNTVLEWAILHSLCMNTCDIYCAVKNPAICCEDCRAYSHFAFDYERFLQNDGKLEGGTAE